MLLTTTPTPDPDLSAVTGEAANWLSQITGTPLTIAIILITGFVCAALARRLVTTSVHGVLVGGGKLRRRARTAAARVTRRDFELGHTTALVNVRRLQRAHTIAALLRAAATFTILVTVVLLVLHTLQVDVMKLLTAAGVVGVVLGFGAQTLIKDVLAGLGMIIEEQFGVGDVVEVGEISGTVEEIRLRVTQVRDDAGTVWYLRNGEVSRVGNRTQGWSLASIDIPVRYDQNLDRARDALLAAGRLVAATSPHNSNVMSEPLVDGIEDLTPEAATLRLQIKTVPTRQWEVARALRAAARIELAGAGIALAGTEASPDLSEQLEVPTPEILTPVGDPVDGVGPLMLLPLLPHRESVLGRKRPNRGRARR